MASNRIWFSTGRGPFELQHFGLHLTYEMLLEVYFISYKHNFCPAVLLFNHNFGKQEPHCNTALCADVTSISSVSFGILGIGNPISVGIVSFSKSVYRPSFFFFIILTCSHLYSFVAIGVIRIVPISIDRPKLALLTVYDFRWAHNHLF